MWRSRQRRAGSRNQGCCPSLAPDMMASSCKAGHLALSCPSEDGRALRLLLLRNSGTHRAAKRVREGLERLAFESGGSWRGFDPPETEMGLHLAAHVSPLALATQCARNLSHNSQFLQHSGVASLSSRDSKSHSQHRTLRSCRLLTRGGVTGVLHFT